MESAATMMMMECIAVMPIPIVCPTTMTVPPAGIISPVPRAVPCVPSIAPEPIVYNGPIDKYRFYYVVCTIDIFITDDLYFYLVFCIFLHVYGGYILEYVLREDSLQYDESLVPLTCLYYAQVVHLSVSIEIQVTECAVRVVKHRLELFQVLSLCEQFSYNLQIESFRDVRTLSGDRYCLICP